MSLRWVELNDNGGSSFIITDSGCGCCSSYNYVNIWSLPTDDSATEDDSENYGNDDSWDLFQAIELQKNKIKELQDVLFKMEERVAQLKKDRDNERTA